MNSPDALRAMTDTLLRVYHDAHRARAHDVAYHALAAAAHAAEDADDAERLGEIEQLAREHLRWLDEHEPEHRHADAPSRRRGHPSIYEQLAVTVVSMRLRVESAQHLRDAQKLRD